MIRRERNRITRFFTLIGTAICREWSQLSSFWVWLGFAGVLLILSKREIIAYSSDASVAVDMALGYLDGSSPPVYSPGLPLFIKLVDCFGIPFRLAQASIVYFAMSMCMYTALDEFASRNLRNFTVANLSFFFSLDPIFVTNGDMTANHLFSGVVAILFVCFWVRVVKSSGEYGLLLPAVFMLLTASIVAISRPDWQVVEFSLVFSTLISACVDRRTLKPAIIMLLLSIVAMQASDFSVRTFNKHVYGIQGQANYLDKRYSEFFSTIAALPSSEVTDRYFLSDSPRRELAYKMSPTLSGIREKIEDKSGSGAIGFDASLKHFGKYDIANAFFYWHLNNVLNLSDSKNFNILGQAAKEIQLNATKQGIVLRYPIAGVLSRDVSLWLAFLPSSIRRVYLYSFEEVPYVKQNSRIEDPNLVSKYNTATLRRAALIKSPEGNDIDYPILSYLYHVLLSTAPWILPLTGVLHAYLIIKSRALRTSDLLWIGMTTIFLSRFAYYALLDASFYSAATWYLVPNHLMWMVMLICNLSAAYRLSRRLVPSAPDVV